MLHYPQESVQLLLTTDASSTAVGGVLEQLTEDGERQPLGFFSHKLAAGQRLWSPYDRELFAIYLSIEHFEYAIRGRPLIVFTDHKPLISMFTSARNIKLDRRARHIEYIAQFTSDIRHISGASNIVADHLSRLEINQIAAPVTIRLIAEEQRVDDEVKAIRSNGYRDHDIRDVYFSDDDSTLTCSFFRNVNRPLVPAKFRFQVYSQIHGLSHPGANATLKLLRDRYIWPNMTSDIRKWHKACIPCQKNKVTRHTRTPVVQFPASEKFEHIHIDIVEPGESHGYRYLLTIIDRFSSWMEAIPLLDIRASTVAQALYTQWIVRYGVPYRLTSDRGAQFVSTLFQELNILLGAEHIRTTSYHPEANGKVERLHRQLKASLRCHGTTWFDVLPAVLLGIRAAPSDETGLSRAEVTFGKVLRLPGEFLQELPETYQSTTDYVANLRSVFQRIRPTTRERNFTKGNIFIHKDLHTCDSVFVRVDKVKTPADAPYDGPYKVLRRAPKWFKLRIGNEDKTVAINRLKPAYILADVPPDSPALSAPIPTRSILKCSSTNTLGNIAVPKRVSFHNSFSKIPAEPQVSPPISPTPTPSTAPLTQISDPPRSVVRTKSGRTVKKPKRYS